MGRHDDQEEKCADCGGDGGWWVTTDGQSGDNKKWVKCTPCGGSGKK